MSVEVVCLDGEVLVDGLPLLVNVHHPSRCGGRACVIHNPTDHPMRSWPLHWRDDRGTRIRTSGTTGAAWARPRWVSTAAAVAVDRKGDW